MRIVDTLTAERIRVVPPGGAAPNKPSVLEMLAECLSTAAGVSAVDIFSALSAREALRSTGIGDGVAIPHAGLAGLRVQIAALVISADGLEFDAIDGRPTHIVVGVVGPERAGGDHLKMLARISRLLHAPETREALLRAESAEAAFSLLNREEARHGAGQ